MENFFKWILIPALINFICYKSFSQIKDLSLQAGTRYDYITDKSNRLQDMVSLRFTYDVKGIFQLVSVLGTGSCQNAVWSTAHTFNDKPADKPMLYPRNLYLKGDALDKKVQWQGGIIPNNPVAGSAGLQPIGWVDGARLKYQAKLADIEVSGGSLTDLNEPNPLERDFKLNFIDILISKKVYDDLLISAGYENWQGDDYIKTDFKYDVHAFTDGVFTLLGSAFYNFETNAVAVDVGTQFDLLKNAINKYEQRLNVKIFYSYLSPDLRLKNQMVPLYFTTGSRITTQLDGKIDQNGKYNWFVRYSYGTDTKQTRLDVGVNMKLNLTPKKKN